MSKVVIILRAWIYTTWVSSAIAILVCLLNREFDPIPLQCMNIAIAFLIWAMHKRSGTW